jgi:hypothetical protein
MPPRTPKHYQHLTALDQSVEISQNLNPCPSILASQLVKKTGGCQRVITKCLLIVRRLTEPMHVEVLVRNTCNPSWISLWIPRSNAHYSLNPGALIELA